MPWSAQSCFMTVSWFFGISFPNFVMPWKKSFFGPGPLHLEWD